MSSPLPAGTKLGRYQIRSLIGTGGMGEVYLADDTLLRRPIAIKLLTGDYSQKEERLHRFELEAYAASSLNHPNIVTIYEIGSENGHNFIATEFVEGESLRPYARNKRLDLSEVVDVITQVASALVAAHEAGIIHRDIKPENIMLRPDGYVKVLDFGLAKLSEDRWHETDAEAVTQLMIKTEPGRVMGTIDYMSPEQARGSDIDQRSDIFSLGIVFYELTARSKPFSGETKSDVLAAVLTSEVVPLNQRRPDVPDELNRIVNKCLRKNRNERYQSTKELLVDLKNLRHEIEFATKSGTLTAHSQIDAPPAITTQTQIPVTTYPSTISELFIKEVKTHPNRSFIVFAAIAAVVIAAGIGLYKLIQLANRTDSFQTMRLAKLTSSGDVNLLAAAVSPDGKYVSYAVIDVGVQSLWIRHVETSSNLQLVAPRKVEFSGLTFSPDGSYLYYTLNDGVGPAIYQIPVLGGPSKKLIDNASGPVSFSSNGKVFAFRRQTPVSQLMIANSDGSAENVVATRPDKEVWLPPAWSPTKAAIVAGYHSLADNKVRLVEISLESHEEKPLPTEAFLSLTTMVWLPDGSGIVMTGRDLETKLFQIWFISYPDGKARRITNDLSSYAAVSVTSDGKTLVSVQSVRTSNLWVAPNGNADQAIKITSDAGRDEGLSGLTWTTDGRILHSQRNAGETDIWSINSDGSGLTQITKNSGRNFYPVATPDGRYIVFISDRNGRNDLWRVDIDGRNSKQLTDLAPVATRPSVSSDGKWVLFGVTVDKIRTIWKVSMEGGQPIKLTQANSIRPLASPTGETFVCHYGVSENLRVAEFSFEGGEPTRTFDLPEVIKSALVQWNNTGDALIYRDSKNRIDNLWLQPLNKSPAKQLTDFRSDQIFAFDWTRDGKNLVLSRGREGSDVVLITQFK